MTSKETYSGWDAKPKEREKAGQSDEAKTQLGQLSDKEASAPAHPVANQGPQAAPAMTTATAITSRTSLAAPHGTPTKSRASSGLFRVDGASRKPNKRSQGAFL